MTPPEMPPLVTRETPRLVTRESRLDSFSQREGWVRLGFIFTFHFSFFALASLPACSPAPLPITQGRAFPPELRQAEVLDIQVFRHETRIEFTNTTARAIPAGTMWLNRRFSRAMPAIAVGQTFDLALDEFQDEFGEHFRAGGFFATREPEKLVQAQIETTDANGKSMLMGLIVIAE